MPKSNETNNNNKQQTVNENIALDGLDIIINYVDINTLLSMRAINKEIRDFVTMVLISKVSLFNKLVQEAKATSTYQVVPAFDMSESNTVAVAAGVSLPAQEVSTNDFAKSIKKRNHRNRRKPFTWTNNLLVPAVVKEWAMNNQKSLPAESNYLAPVYKKFLKELKIQAQERLRNPFKGLVITKVDDVIGYGLRTDAFIPSGTLIGFYAGKLINFSPKRLQFAKRDYYSFRLENKHPLFEANNIKCSSPEFAKFNLGSITAKNYGNEMSFMLDAPHESELTEIFVDHVPTPSTLNRNIIATQNVSTYDIFHNGMPLKCCVVLYDIQPGDMLFISYGDEYWKGMEKVGIKRCFFTKKGEVLDFNANVEELEQQPMSPQLT